MPEKGKSDNTPQLTLLTVFDLNDKRESKLVEALLEEIKNLKYYRINTRFSEMENKRELEQLFNSLLFLVASLAHKKSKYIPKYRGRSLESFLDLTREKAYLSVSEPLSSETLSEYYLRGESRLKTILMAYRDLLVNDKPSTKEMLSIFKKIHTLA